MAEVQPVRFKVFQIGRQRTEGVGLLGNFRHGDSHGYSFQSTTLFSGLTKSQAKAPVSNRLA